MKALHDVVQAGYARYIGMSSCWAWQCGCFLFPPHLNLTHHQLVYAMQSMSPTNLYIEIFILMFYSDYAIQNNLTPFISMQNQYSLIYREEEREMMPLLKVRL